MSEPGAQGPVALEPVQLPEPLLHLGGDQAVGDAGTYEVIDPTTEQVVGLAADAGAAQAEQAAQAAAGALEGWAATEPEERATLLDRAADLVEQHHDELVALAVAETGGTRAIAENIQVPQVVARLRRYARGALEPTVIPFGPTISEATALAPAGVSSSMAQRLPVGVVACITSYNFPMVNMAGKIAPALAMGNTVVLKPAPQDPLGVVRLVELLHEAGFPPGVVNVVTGTSAEIGRALTTSPAVDMVSFTGSTAVGQEIGEAAGGGMKRLLLELGGKGACLVFDDADLSAAVSGIVSVWGFHSGQICTAPTRVIAQRGIYDQLVDTLAQVSELLTVGDPRVEGTVVGPVISAAQRERIEAHVAQGRADGAEIVVGGERPDLERGFFVAPTLAAGCTNDMAIAREEIFGPVVVVIPFDHQDEAVALANDSELGLYDYVYTADRVRALELTRRLRAGNVGINTLARNSEAPFGGFKQSGVGRDGGSFGLHAYSELQTVIWPG
jgi:acyl-CoA reductase-like NAD-dependent aldehyde dehydrogenase